MAGLAVVDPVQIIPEEDSSIDEETAVLNQSISDFYRRNDISWQSPHVRHRVILRQKNEKGKTIGKSYVQKRFMVMSIKEAYHLFTEENPHVNVGLTKFRRMKPVEIDFFLTCSLLCVSL